MKTIYIIPIEPLDQRYTKQWYENLPRIIVQQARDNNVEVKVVTIDGDEISSETTRGAFLDFAATNVYKSSQAHAVSKLFAEGKINPGDKFLITDAWNFIITPIKYMSELLDIPVEIHSIWHAGAYDATDILGMKMSKPWPWVQEQCWALASDYNYYATDFHRNMFMFNLGIDESMHGAKFIRSGQPHDPIVGALEIHQKTPKQRSVLWPHRYNDDKQPSIAEDLAQDFNMVITQKMNLNKQYYYTTMGQMQVIFSCALHENLGISVMEGCLSGAIPIVPDRCSYAEMYLPEFKYPSVWTQDYESYQSHRAELVEFIQQRLDNPQQYAMAMQSQQQILKKNYLNADVMIGKLLGI